MLSVFSHYSEYCRGFLACPSLCLIGNLLEWLSYLCLLMGSKDTDQTRAHAVGKFRPFVFVCLSSHTIDLASESRSPSFFFSQGQTDGYSPILFQVTLYPSHTHFPSLFLSVLSPPSSPTSDQSPLTLSHSVSLVRYVSRIVSFSGWKKHIHLDIRKLMQEMFIKRYFALGLNMLVSR